jgi:hypothetical protein
MLCISTSKCVSFSTGFQKQEKYLKSLCVFFCLLGSLFLFQNKKILFFLQGVNQHFGASSILEYGYFTPFSSFSHQNLLEKATNDVKMLENERK